MDARQQLTDFYATHNPSKLKDVDRLLDTFRGREQALLDALRHSYGEGHHTHAETTSSKQPPPHALSGEPEREGETRHEAMRRLIDQMSCVDLAALQRRVEDDAAASVVSACAGQLEVVSHTLTFMRYFLECSREFMRLAEEEEGQQQQQQQRTLHDTQQQREEAQEKEEESPRHALALAPLCPSFSSRTVLTLHPNGEGGVVGAAVRAGLVRSGTCISLHPGVYYESVHLEDCGAVEVTSAFPGAPVVWRPLSDLEPALTVRGASSALTVSGVVFITGELDPTLPSPPADAAPRDAPRVALVSAETGASLQLRGCHVYHGGGSGGVLGSGDGTRVVLQLCLLSLCQGAGLGLSKGASGSLKRCRVRLCEVGIVVGPRATLVVQECTVEESSDDGLVLGGTAARVTLERSSVFNNGGSGVYVAGGAGLEVTESTIELNARYGIQRLCGAHVHLLNSFVRDNALLPVNDEVSR